MKGTNGGELNEQPSCDGFAVMNVWLKWQPTASGASLRQPVFNSPGLTWTSAAWKCVYVCRLLGESVCERARCHVSSKPFIKEAMGEGRGGRVPGRCGAIRFRRSCTQPPFSCLKPHPHPIWTGMNKNHWSIWNVKQTSWVGNSYIEWRTLWLERTSLVCAFLRAHMVPFNWAAHFSLRDVLNAAFCIDCIHAHTLIPCPDIIYR